MRIKIDNLDKLFSRYIRLRSEGYDEYTGKYAGYDKLQCCHFHSRSKKSVRLDPDNAIAATFGSHQYLDSHPMEKVEFWKQKLGEQKFDMLNSRARTPAKDIDKEAIGIYLAQEIKKLEKSNETNFQ